MSSAKSRAGNAQTDRMRVRSVCVCGVCVCLCLCMCLQISLRVCKCVLHLLMLPCARGSFRSSSVAALSRCSSASLLRTPSSHDYLAFFLAFKATLTKSQHDIALNWALPPAPQCTPHCQSSCWLLLWLDINLLSAPRLPAHLATPSPPLATCPVNCKIFKVSNARAAPFPSSPACLLNCISVCTHPNRKGRQARKMRSKRQPQLALALESKSESETAQRTHCCTVAVAVAVGVCGTWHVACCSWHRF